MNLKLAEAEAKSAPRPDGVLSSRLQALFQLSRPLSRFSQNLGNPCTVRGSLSTTNAPYRTAPMPTLYKKPFRVGRQ
jgi:hypothetical protein